MSNSTTTLFFEISPFNYRLSYFLAPTKQKRRVQLGTYGKTDFRIDTILFLVFLARSNLKQRASVPFRQHVQGFVVPCLHSQLERD